MRVTKRKRAAWVVGLLALIALGGCARGPMLIPAGERISIDRGLVEYPAGFELQPYIRNLTAPSAIAFDAEGSLLVAEGGIGGHPVRIVGFRTDGTRFDVYPRGRGIPFVKTGFQICGPVGGMVAHGGKIYVSHRDEDDNGVITALDYDGGHATVVAGLPAAGDHGVTDLAVDPGTGRLYFGVGSATNSGVVGLDNWRWANEHPQFCDQPYSTLKLLGYRFDTPNPKAGLFGGNDIAVTAPFQPFAVSNQTWIRKAANEKPSAAIYSISPGGGDLRVEAHGIRNPRGLVFNQYGRLYFTNNGMELRGTRPVKDDPDALLRLVRGAWYGWPDYSTDLIPISERRFQPPPELIIKTGYPDLSFLIDHQTSGLLKPDRNTLLQAVFSPLSGAAKMDITPEAGAFREFRGNLIVALHGDHAPFATGGYPLRSPVGRKIMRVDVDARTVKDFIRNTQGLPASQAGNDARLLERPVDVKFGPDGAMYILDFGRMKVKGARREAPTAGGRIYRLAAEPASAAP